MGSQNIFQRVEKKYKLNEEQYRAFFELAKDKLIKDEYGLHTIRNLYFDTEHYDLIRQSIEKPRYKEKFRIRGYGDVGEDSTVFLEIKKKYKGIVYKRRISLPCKVARDYIEKGIVPEVEDKHKQILREIDYFLNFYKPQPKVYLAYDRVAYVGKDDPELRLTIDQNIRSRYENLHLTCDEGCEVLNPDIYLMEIKVPQAYPMWLAELLSKLEIYPASFSKYGTVYSNSVKTGELHPWLEEIDEQEKRKCLQVF